MAEDPLWGKWIPIDGGWVRRRPRVLGENDDQWGKWELDRKFNEQFRVNPISNGTHIQTTSDEFQFHWNIQNRPKITSQDIKAEHNSASQGTNDNSQEEVIDKSSTSSLNSSSSSPNVVALNQVKVENQTTDIKATEEPKHNGCDDKEPIITPSPPPAIQGSIRLDQKAARQQKGSLPGNTTSVKSGLASLNTAVAATVDPISAPVITATSAADRATAVAAYIFGPIMAGLGVGTLQATRKSAQANVDAAKATKDSAEAAIKSANAAEDGVRIMQKQLEAKFQSQQGPPPPPHSSNTCPRSNETGHGMRFAEASSQDQSPASKPQGPPSLSIVESPSPDNGSFSTWMNAVEEVAIPLVSLKPAEPAKAAKQASNQPVASMSQVSRPRVLTSKRGEPSARTDQAEQVSSAKVNTRTPSRVSVLQKETELRNIRRYQEEQKAQKSVRESRLVLEKSLQELRNKYT